MLMEEIAVAAQAGIESAGGHAEPGHNRGPMHEARNFELPSSIWTMMFACYAIFLGSLALLVGGSFRALGMVFISACFTIMYFGTAAVMVRVARNDRERQGLRHEAPTGPVETLTGTLSYGAAATQVLIVPAMLGLFAVCILGVRIVIG